MSKFDSNLICDTVATKHGSACWDNYLRRYSRPKLHPIVPPENGIVVTNTCEAAPFAKPTVG